MNNTVFSDVTPVAWKKFTQISCTLLATFLLLAGIVLQFLRRPVNFYQTTWPHIPGDRVTYMSDYRCGIWIYFTLKSRNYK
jgi:hypothetical protein